MNNIFFKWWLVVALTCISAQYDAFGTRTEIARRPHEVTLITCFYDLNTRSKHSSTDYFKWTASFISRVVSPVVIYTDSKSHNFFVTARAQNPTIIEVVDLWSINCLAGKKEILEQQHAIDPEKSIHYPELYMIWDSKSCMVNNTAAENPFGSKYFFWVDIGSFRSEHTLRHWPSLERLGQVFAPPNQNRLLLGKISAIELSHTSYDQGLITRDVIEGGFFGGGKAAIEWWTNEFYRVLWIEHAKGSFIGKDQYIMNLIASVNKHMVFFIDAHSQKQKCEDPWFYFQQYLAAANETRSHCPTPAEPLVLVK